MYISLIISIKWLDDRYYWNSDVCDKLTLFDVQATNKYEHLFLNLLDFKMSVHHSKFDSYYKWLLLYSKFIEQETESKGLTENEMTVDS